jgi:hypothetical protein
VGDGEIPCRSARCDRGEEAGESPHNLAEARHYSASGVARYGSQRGGDGGDG